MQKIIKNAIQCNLCGDIIESTYRHDFVTYKCGCCSVDEGLATAHYIRERALSEVVLEHLRETVEYVQEYEAEFVQIIMDKSRSEQKKEFAQKRRELAQAERRVDELDGLFQRIY